MKLAKSVTFLERAVVVCRQSEPGNALSTSQADSAALDHVRNEPRRPFSPFSAFRVSADGVREICPISAGHAVFLPQPYGPVRRGLRSVLVRPRLGVHALGDVAVRARDAVQQFAIPPGELGREIVNGCV